MLYLNAGRVSYFGGKLRAPAARRIVPSQCARRKPTETTLLSAHYYNKNTKAQDEDRACYINLV